MYQPYDYQTECLDAIDLARYCGRALIVMATGLGKSVVMAFDAKKWRGEQGSKVLFLCHNNDILYQAKPIFEAINGTDSSYGYFNGVEKNFHKVDFLFASLQTMERCKDLFAIDEFAYVMVDESHHSRAGTFRSTIEYFKPKFLLGATATPDRLDELDIREIFGKEIYNLPLAEAMARDLLTPVDYRLLTDEIQLTEFLKTDDGTKISLAELNRKIFLPRRDQEIAKIIARNVAGIENPRIIIFCTSIAHCQHLAEFIPNSFAIHSEIPEKERNVRFEMFRQGIIGTVLVVDAFNEGVDIPQANLLVFLRSTVSQTIFLQQLGRGLRKSDGKDKVVVLDFVSNCERIKMVHTLWRDVDARTRRDEASATKRHGAIRPMTLNISSSEFTETIVPLLSIIDRVRPNFYTTWEEASRAVVSLGVRGLRDYQRMYRMDPRLPSNLYQTYKDFPGWDTFLGRTKIEFYPTWKKAGEAAQRLGIKTRDEYYKRRKEDPKLLGAPDKVYKDFPSWVLFLGGQEKEPYPTWQEAAKAAKALEILSSVEYLERYKEDPKLPSNPHHMYEGFRWKVFFGGEEKEFYATWQEAGNAAKALGITSEPKYVARYKEDPKLPSRPFQKYRDFPGWKEFLGKSSESS